MKTFSVKPKIYFDEGSLESLKLEIHAAQGSSAFILCDPMMDKLGYLQKVKNCLQSGGIKYSAYTKVKPDPDSNAVVATLAQYLAAGSPDTVIALGGGSAMDTTKAMMYFLSKTAISLGKPFKKPLFVAIPTTSGTGSEVTDFAIIGIGGRKLALIDEMMLADVAILDSTCTSFLPPKVIADTGIDALSHAIEAYGSTAATEYTDALAGKAARIIFEDLETMYHNPGDTRARERMYQASCMAGMAFTNAGLGIIHSMAHAFGGTFHVPHGRSIGLVMDKVIEYNADLQGTSGEYAAEKYAELAEVIRLQSRTVREGFVNFASAVQRLKRAIGYESNIRALGIDQAAFDGSVSYMADGAMADRCTPTNPRKPTKEDIIALYKASY